MKSVRALAANLLESVHLVRGHGAVPTCAELVARIVAEAEAIIGSRLDRMMSARSS